MSAARFAVVPVALTLLVAVAGDAHSQDVTRVTVAPEGDLASRRLVDETTFEVQFAVTNRGTERDVFQLTCGGLGTVQCAEVYPTEVAVPAGETVRVVAAAATKGVGRGLLVLIAFSPTTLTRVASEHPVTVAAGGDHP